MKPMTIEQIKRLPVDDWLYIKILTKCTYWSKKDTEFYVCKMQEMIETELAFDSIHVQDYLKYEDYGKTWVAYKNKESMCIHQDIPICIFPECESQDYCIEAMLDAVRGEIK